MKEQKKIKEYSNGEVTIVWEPAICSHSEVCINRLPEVYNPYGKPWITIKKATTGQLKEQISKCPSGALSYYMNDEDKTTTKSTNTEVIIMPDGPMVVSGNITVIGADGKSDSKSSKTAFCRCGASRNKPYCDGSHAKIEFKG